MTNVFCVRAEFGRCTKSFVEGGYVAIGWIPDVDLSTVTARDDLYPLYKAAHPQDVSNIVIGQQVGQVARFLLEMKAGDYVLTPAADTEWLHYGTLGRQLVDLLVEHWTTSRRTSANDSGSVRDSCACDRLHRAAVWEAGWRRRGRPSERVGSRSSSARPTLPTRNNALTGQQRQ